MRSLATASYTDAQVAAQLRASSAATSARFDVLDNDLNVVAALQTVTAATVALDVDQKIKGSLALTMLPDASLVGRFLQRKIRPWFRLLMPDGGIAEWPMGVYPWTRPKRSLATTGKEIWTATLGDQEHLLDLSGPGPTGLRAPAGTNVRDAIVATLARVGITDTSGIAAIATVVPTDMVWTVAGGGGGGNAPGAASSTPQPATLLDVEAQLHDSAGIYGPWFDLSGVYRAAYVPDLSTVAPSTTYKTDPTSILLGLDTDDDLSKFANRILVRSTATTAWFTGAAIADADVLYPGHPASHAVTGYYVDIPLDDAIATTLDDLQRRANSELHQRLSFDLTINIPTLANPAHEAYDVIGIQWTGDSEFSSSTRFSERAWTFDLMKGTMTHKLNRLYG